MVEVVKIVFLARDTSYSLNCSDSFAVRQNVDCNDIVTLRCTVLSVLYSPIL